MSGPLDDLQELSRQRLAQTAHFEAYDPAATMDPSRKSQPRRSGRVRTADERIVKEVDWPHYFVWSHKNGDRFPATYNDLSVEQFVQGFIACVKQEDDPGVRNHMLTYLGTLMRDAVEVPWHSCRAFNAIVLHEMESGVLHWGDKAGIAELRHNYIDRTPKQPAKSVHTTPCPAYNYGNCKEESDHSGSQALLRHICSYCARSQGAAFHHPAVDCKKKVRASTQAVPKNGE